MDSAPPPVQTNSLGQLEKRTMNLTDNTNMTMLSVTNLDKNLINSAIKEKDVVWNNCLDTPFSLHGLFFSKEENVFRRLPKEVAEKVSPAVSILSKHTSGWKNSF